MGLTPQEEAKFIAGTQILPAGTATVLTHPFAQTFDQRLAISTAYAPTSARLEVTSIWLPQGAVVTGITFVSGAQAEATGTHLWYALYDQNRVLLAQSADDTGATSFAANTALRKALSAAQTCKYTGLYYLGFCCVASGTVPTLLNSTVATVNATGNIAGMTPILAGYGDTGLTTTAPATATAFTAITQCLYACVD